MIYKIIFVIVILTLLSSNIFNQTPDGNEVNGCLPDIKFDKVHFDYLKYSKPKSKPGTPRRNMIRSPYAIRFYISISNIGTADWNNDLHILYTFDENVSFIADTLVVEELYIPYALKETIELNIKYPARKPKFIRFYLNTTKTDSLEQYRLYDEFYYKNNIVQIDLKD